MGGRLVEAEFYACPKSRCHYVLLSDVEVEPDGENGLKGSRTIVRIDHI